MPADPALIERFGLRDFGDEDLFEMSFRRLRDLFDFPTTGNLDVTSLLRNLVWQDHERIMRGDRPPFSGNVRTYWYMRAKPLLSRLRTPEFDEKYGMTLARFAEFTDAGMVRYRDFGFKNPKEGMHHIGRFNPHILLLVEKEGQEDIAEVIKHDYGCTTLITQGNSSILAMEYFVDDLASAGLIDARLEVVTLVDYDPAGANIVETVEEHIRGAGFVGTFSQQDIVLPERMTREQIRLNRYKLPKNTHGNRQTLDWAQRTGGLTAFGHGRFMGLEGEAMSDELVAEVFDELVAGKLRVPKETVVRFRLKEELMELLQAVFFKRHFG